MSAFRIIAVSGRKRISAAVFVVLAMCGVLLSSSARLEVKTPSAQPVSEYAVKAGYLLLFARYVQWPEQAFASSSAPLIVAVVGRDPFGAVLDETLRDQRIGKHSVQVVRIPRLTTEAKAHIAFVATTPNHDEQRWLQIFRDQPTLTVGESSESLDNGAIVQLAQHDGRVRFDIDWLAAQRVDLRIASPMLVAARQVRGAPVESSNGAQP